jgi:uncharacterized protein
MKQNIINGLKIFGKFFLLILVWSGGIALVSTFDKEIEALGKPTSAFLFEFLPLIFILIPTLLIWKFLDKEKIENLEIFPKNFIKNTISGTIIAIFWIGLAVLGLSFFCKLKTNFNIAIGYKMIIVYFVILLINTIMQEVLCRGYLFKTIEKSFSTTTAVIVTSVFFVLLHPGAIDSGFIGTLNVFFAGLVFGIARKMSGNLWLPITIHIVWNFLDSVVFGISPLGLYPHLDLIKVTGQELFTGGKNGLSTSIITLFTFPFLFLMFYFDVLKINVNLKKII